MCHLLVLSTLVVAADSTPHGKTYESGSPGDHAEHRASSKYSEHVALARSELLSREANGVLRFICQLIDSQNIIFCERLYGLDFLYLVSSSVIYQRFPGGSDGKEFAHNARDLGSILGSGKSLGEGNDNPLQYSCLDNSMERGAWQAIVMGSQRVGDD